LCSRELGKLVEKLIPLIQELAGRLTDRLGGANRAAQTGDLLGEAIELVNIALDTILNFTLNGIQVEKSLLEAIRHLSGRTHCRRAESGVIGAIRDGLKGSEEAI
jgi:hypothetical protein